MTGSREPQPAPLPRGQGAQAWALVAFGRMPEWLRLGVIRWLTPNYTLGALCLLEHDGRLLMLQQSHRRGWTLPGGLVDRGETAAQGACREVTEEIGLRVEVGLPIGTVVEPRQRRADVIFHVPVPVELEVRPRGEAVRAAWLTPEEAGPVDLSTGQALALWASSRRPDAYRGALRD
jgi:8-oxo-dGTP diphosphatase